jgi:hypothetical protein
LLTILEPNLAASVFSLIIDGIHDSRKSPDSRR